MIGAQSASVAVPRFSNRLLAQSWRRPDRSALVISKMQPGFDNSTVSALRALLAEVAAGNFEGLKYLVLDFAHTEPERIQTVEGFGDLIAANAGLVETSVITIAWTRGLMSGHDLEFAMSCSAIVAEKDSRFSFSGEPFALLGLYAALGRKIGFIRAERLVETDNLLSAEEMRDLLIVRDVVEPAPDFVGVDAYLTLFERRYNAAQAIFRAQRMAEPPIDRQRLEASLRR